MSLSFRLTLAILILAATQLGVAYIRGGTKPVSVTMPDFDLRELPYELGQWQGEEVEMPARVQEVLDAEVSISRRYHDAYGYTISLHSAVFLDYGMHSLHSPSLCYSGSGYQILSSTPAPFQTDAGETVSAELMTAARDAAQIRVLFWYQLGPFTFGSRAMKPERRAYWGQPVWPALIKVMISDAHDNPDASRERMTDLAKHIYTWMNSPKSTAPAP